MPGLVIQRCTFDRYLLGAFSLDQLVYMCWYLGHMTPFLGWASQSQLILPPRTHHMKVAQMFTSTLDSINHHSVSGKLSWHQKQDLER